MPDRTKEELITIRDDILQVIEARKMMLEYSPLVPTPLNGKSWKEERTEWFDRAINYYGNLIKSDKVKSCEITSLCKAYIAEGKEEKAFADRYSYVAIYHSVNPLDHKGEFGYSLLDMRDELNAAIAGKLSKSELGKLNKLLDSIGSSGCKVIAYDFPDLSISNMNPYLASSNSKKPEGSKFL